MKEFVALRAKTWAYLMDDDTEYKTAEGTNGCVIKRRLMLENYTDCSFNEKIILKSQRRFKSDYDNLYAKQVNKVVLSSNDDIRLQTFDKITTYPDGTSAFKT